MQRILVIGAGFAGMWSALSAKRLLETERGERVAVEVALVAPEPILVIRPRLYEDGANQMSAPLQDVFDAVGIRYIRGYVDRIDVENSSVEFVYGDGARSAVSYDRLILASGSRLFRPDVPGLNDHAFSIDQLDEAAAFEAHCRSLANLPDTPARNTFIVAGGGFTGIEIAAELPRRMKAILGDDVEIRVVVVEQACDIGPDLGPGPRPFIQQAFTELGIETRLGAKVTAIDHLGVMTSQGERIESLSVVWTAGMRASALTQQIPGARDEFGRLHVDRDLRVLGLTNVFAAGDTAFASTDEDGHHAKMSCQHATNLGKSAGNNAAADLLGVPSAPYSQERYGTCLDLGPWGAVVSDGWDRVVQRSGQAAKPTKQYINQVLIYPPKADRAEALAAADPNPSRARVADLGSVD